MPKLTRKQWEILTWMASDDHHAPFMSTPTLNVLESLRLIRRLRPGQAYCVTKAGRAALAAKVVASTSKPVRPAGDETTEPKGDKDQ